MVRLRIDPRLLSRVDASDIVQDALAEAHRGLPEYAAERPIPFYPWLRQLAWVKLIEMHRRHVEAQRRSVRREDRHLSLSTNSEVLLADRLSALGTASKQLIRQEQRRRVREAIAGLPDTDQEVIVLKHLGELSSREAAAVLGISDAAFYSRYYRAIKRLHRYLNED